MWGFCEGLSSYLWIAGLLFGFCAGVMNVVRAAKEGMDGSGTDLPPELDED